VLQDYQDELKGLAEKNPGLVKPVVLPKRTFQGREIMGVEISRRVDRTDDGKPTYFVMGMHHAREWPSAEAAMEFAHLLVQGNGEAPRITRLLDRVRVVVVPIINVDGFVESREGGMLGLPDLADTTGVQPLQTVEGVALLGGSFAYRRKNCNGAIPSGDVPCTLQWGVDPNRNYGNGWGGPGAGSDPITQSYRGTGPFSEPETQAVWLFSRERQVTNLITLHNVAALVLRPPGLHDAGKAPDEPGLKRLGDAMAAATGYVSQYSFELYDTSGTTDDYTYASQGGYAYTIEMGPSGGQFHMPYQTGVVDEWRGKPGTPAAGKGLREALLLGAEAAASPADHAILRGKAPAGRVLRIRKDFQTETSDVCLYSQGYLNSSGGGTPADCPARGGRQAFDDKVESTLTVPKGGGFTWHVNPSTRPFVGARYVDGGDVPLGDPQTFTPTAAENKLVLGAVDKALGSVEREFAVADGADAVSVDLTWAATPQDYDLDVYRVAPDGSRQQVGTSGNAPASFERVVVTDPSPGTYVLSVVYYASVANDWKATVQQLQSRPDRVESTGRTEAYTLTCETTDGTVLSTQQVTIARGKTLSVEPRCGKKGR
jgi:Zinc carboxypeptidase